MGPMLIIALIAASALILLLLARCFSIERSMLFFPTHETNDNGLTRWIHNGEIIGWSRPAESPRNVWLMLHGNGGQATDRVYALPCFSSDDSVYVMEYPGYGPRKGKPSKETFNRAAAEAYRLLRTSYPGIPVCVVSESIGCGPAASLAAMSPPPDKLVLIVPFEKLSLAAKEHVPSVLVNLFLRSNWDNVSALSKSNIPVEIYGAGEDTIVPVKHAKALADAIPLARFVLIEGGHNEWSQSHRVRIRNS